MEQDAVEHVQDPCEVCGLKSSCQSCEVLAIAVEDAVRPDKETSTLYLYVLDGSTVTGRTEREPSGHPSAGDTEDTQPPVFKAGVAPLC